MDGDGGVETAAGFSVVKTPERIRGGECEVVEMSSRISTVVLVPRSRIGDGSILPDGSGNSSSSSLVVDPEHIGALWRRVDEAKGFRRAWHLDFWVAETCCLDGDFLIAGTGYNTGFSSSVGCG
jgi:hypothetical protein